MDCCNYLPYRQPYYGGAYYDHLSYPGDFYGHPYHEYGYGSSPYYAQPWACAPPIPDYVYNPKEARIRKAMREVSRDRGLGSASMTGARNSGRRPPAWMPGPEDPLMMTPPQTMRAPMPSAICGASFPMPSEPSPFMNAYNKLGHILPPSSDSMHSSNSYMQTTMPQNAMVNMQHEPNLWQGYHDVMTSRPSNGYMLPELPGYTQQLQEPQTRENPNTSIPTDIKPQIELQNFNNPPSIPTPEKLAKDNEREDQKLLHPDTMYAAAKIEIDEAPQNIMRRENMQTPEQFLPVYNNNMPGHFNSSEEVKMKKPASIKHKTNNNNNTSPPLKSSNKPLPDFNEAFGSTERGRFQSPPDPRLAPNKDYLDYFYDNNTMKYSDFHI